MLRMDLSFRLGPYTDVFGEIVECRAWLLYQLKDFLIAFPSSDIGLGVRDVQGHLQMVVVYATVAFFHSHLIAVRGAVLVKPASGLEAVRVDDKRVSLPMANCISVPTGVRRFGVWKFSPIGPNVAPGAVVLEELNHFIISLGKPHSRRRGVPQDTWKTRRITPPDRVIPILFVRESAIA